MAFWGIEVKPGKPYIHKYDDEQGRLHVSQATLGDYSSTKRILLQCTAGDKSPVYLCSLLPGKNETCSLNIEFEEEDEVTLSVVGPHSVHLSGYFYGQSEDQCGHDHGIDGYGEDIDIGSSDSEYEESSDYDLEDDEDDSIDEDMDFFPPATVPKSGVRIEEIIDDEEPVKENNGSRLKKKKSKSVGSDDNDNSQKQIAVRSGIDSSVMESEDEDGFPISTPGTKDTSVQNTGEKKVADKATEKKGKDNDASIKSIKRKIQAVAEDVNQLREPGQSLGGSADHEIDDKQARMNKKKKTRGTEEKVQESVIKSDIAVLPAEVPTTNVNQEAANENKSEVPTSKREKKKKKKGKKQDSVAEANGLENLSENNASNMNIKEKNEIKPLQERTFPNGLVIRELGMGKPDGRKATPGKKVSVHYTGKLKKNGKIFDSNVGRAPFKFRLGIGQVIKGWDVGVNGMRIGDKRRLTIPPAMGYGSKGAGGSIPPNSWLVFDVELVDVN
ncbi:peptidyl-prolyl cis-trans isomerase FKBP53 [Daucus carota subsp. sativus]|uniref:peptidylprolyl isomerase n=1 Tax=Daucus carota subsp. sativus TaxID=79200 RepID=A0A164WY55_DAUCS|nr:PREDICTED: peptidyl-prolyl cis-trans isomerase FKBP53 [Daucus carota subsp. sativus]